MTLSKKPTGEFLSLSRDDVYQFVKAWLARPSSTHTRPPQRILHLPDGGISVLRGEAEKILTEPDMVEFIYLELLKAERQRDKDESDS